MAAELLRHPRGALIRRLGWATYGPGLASAALLLFVLSGALPGWVWPLPLALIPLTLTLAVVAYRALGHAWAAPYLVVRRGALNRRTVALQERAVIGWTLRQSILQRWAGRITPGVSTAAGDRHYEVPDAGLDQALALVSAVTPGLAAQFLEADQTSRKCGSSVSRGLRSSASEPAVSPTKSSPETSRQASAG